MKNRSVNDGVTMAAITAAAMIAEQVGGKAIRDALFLSRFPVTALPVVALATALLSVGLALLAARILTTQGPHRVIPATFAASALMLLVLWRLGQQFPRGQAVALYFHISVVGMVQISGFWSLVNESFDLRTAKRRIGRIAAGGTLGGLLGGIFAERVGSIWGIHATLPMLAGLHLLCAVTSLGLRPLDGRGRAAARVGILPVPRRKEEGVTRLGLRVLRRTPHLRSLAAFVLLSTVAAAFLDYVFKMQAAQHMSGTALLRLFAGFYTAVGLVTFVIQTTLSRRIIERTGLARAVASLPLSVAAGSLGALMAPGPVMAGVARGIEAVLRNSLYRSGYEVLFSSMPAREKRATKAIVDVGFERMGDALGAATVQLVLLVAAAMIAPLLLGLAIICSLAGLAIAQRLQGGYLATLERNLLVQAEELDLPDLTVSAPGDDLADTLGQISWAEESSSGFLVAARELAGESLRESAGDAASESLSEFSPPATDISTAAPELSPAASELSPAAPELSHDRFFQRVLDLHSGDPGRARRALLESGPIDRAIAPHVIPLLAWEPVADAALQALRPAALQIVGQLVDSLLDPEEDFAIRRRIPRLLSDCPSPVAVEGLLQGLLDRRFEVRFRCGRALLRLYDAHGMLPLESDRIYLTVIREVAVDRRVWESQKLLDLQADENESPFVDQVLRERASRSLEHVFTLLSLVLPRQPLQVAFRGLYADDPMLRGTSLEYLESILPPHVRDALWPLLEDHRPRVPTARSREEILADLVRSNESIAINLEELRRRTKGDQVG